MQINIKQIVQKTASDIMSTRPYNNLPFLVDVIKSKLQFPESNFEEICEFARRKQAHSLASYDCQFQSQSLQAILYELGIKSQIILFEDEISQHVALKVEDYIYDCTFGCTVGAKTNVKNIVKNNTYFIDDSSYNVQTVLKEKGHEENDPKLEASFKIISINQSAKELYYYTSRNFLTTIFLGTLWRYDDDGNMIANLGITINNEKIILNIRSDINYFESELSELNMNQTEFTIPLKSLTDNLKISYTEVYNQIFFIKSNLNILKQLKILN